ncbi:septum formation initiator [Streptomyces stramineus]
MTIRILPAIGDPDAARAICGLLGQLPGVEPLRTAVDSTRLLDTLAALAATSVEELPEVVLVHERLGPVPALELIREVALRFPATGVVLVTADTGPALYAAAMDSGARGLAGLPLSYDELGARVQAAAQWATGVRRHLGGDGARPAGRRPKRAARRRRRREGGVGTTVTAVQLALAASAAGRGVALVDMDLQSGDVASYLDVQFRRSIADLAGIGDLSPRVLQDAVFPHPTGLGLLLAPAEGSAARRSATSSPARSSARCAAATRSSSWTAGHRSRPRRRRRDCGRGAARHHPGRGVRAGRQADGPALGPAPDPQGRGDHHRRQPPHPSRGDPAAPRRTHHRHQGRPHHDPRGYKELQPAVDAGRMQDLDPKSPVRQALWALAGELGLAAPAGRGQDAGRPALGGSRRRRALGPGGTGADRPAALPAGRFRRRGEATGGRSRWSSPGCCR